MSPPALYMLFLGTLFLLILLYSIIMYAKFSNLKKMMESSLSKIDNSFEEIIKLVKFMKDDIRKHVSDDKILKIISTEMRRISIKERISLGEKLEGMFQAMSEITNNDPNIRDYDTFMKTRGQLNDLKSELDSAMVVYDKAAANSKKLLSSFPSFLVGLLFNFPRIELFAEKN